MERAFEERVLDPGRLQVSALLCVHNQLAYILLVVIVPLHHHIMDVIQLVHIIIKIAVGVDS